MEASTKSHTDINTYMAELGYQYVYDHLNRLVEKQLPGKGREYIIYNKLDQPVMTQDANQRANHEWLFTKYDAFGRVAYTGLYTHTGSISRADMQSDLDGHYMDGNGDRNGTAMYEERDNANAANYKYTNNTFPTADLDILTVNYYDDYDFDRAGTGETVTALGVANDPYVKGLATGSKVKVLDPSAGPGQADWITTVNYYDAKGRPIHTYSHNTYLGTTDIVETQLDFIGRPVKVRTGHTRNGVTIVTIDNFSYDHVGRLLAQTQCIGDGTLGDECPAVGNLDADLLWDGLGTIDSDTEAAQSITVRDADIVPGTDGTSLRIVDDGGQELIVYNNYDELGQLVHKKVGGTPGSGYSETQGLQEVDYTYNVRGWLKSINNPTLLGNDLFAFGINYNSPTHDGTALYNGNIAETEWRTADTESSLKWYKYEFDALNRIKSAADNTADNRYGLTNVEYDKNGNITKLARNGHTAIDDNGFVRDFGVMDNLVYSYTPSTNKLMKVTDTAPLDQFGFRDDALNTAPDSNDDYVYDQNGNMILDDNKGIVDVDYNHFELPVLVDFGGGNKVEYVYDALGNKLKKEVTDVANGNSEAEYAGNFLYENGSLRYFSHSEGYVEPSGNGRFLYIYQYKDHLGGVRLAYSDNNGDGSIDPSNEIVEEKNYYPYGMIQKGYNGNINGVQNNYITYNGKEFDVSLDMNIYDLGARMYDPAIGRFMVIDPMADFTNYQSPYVIADNNPVFFIDEFGFKKGKCGFFCRLVNRVLFGKSKLIGGQGSNRGKLKSKWSQGTGWAYSSKKLKGQGNGDNGSSKCTTCPNDGPRPTLPSFNFGNASIAQTPLPTFEPQLIEARTPNPRRRNRQFRIPAAGQSLMTPTNIRFVGDRGTILNTNHPVSLRTLTALLGTLIATDANISIVISSNYYTTEPLFPNIVQRGNSHNSERANAIRTFLIENGIDPSRIQIGQGGVFQETRTQQTGAQRANQNITIINNSQ